MSAESKTRDLWRQLDAYAHDRDDFCVGCGYYHAANGRHRNDCTRDETRDETRSPVCPTQTGTEHRSTATPDTKTAPPWNTPTPGTWDGPR